MACAASGSPPCCLQPGSWFIWLMACERSQVIFMDIAVVNKMRLEEMHVKVDELFHMAATAPVEVSNAAALLSPPASTDTSAPATATPGVNSAGVLHGLETSAMPKASAAAADTAKHLAAQGFQPLNAPLNANATAQQAAPAGTVSTAAETNASTAPAKAAESADLLALAARNKDRMTNVIFFFVFYAGFKWATEQSA